MPGQDLFQYEDDDGAVRGVGSADVNDYIREAAGADFTAKDFRTWHGSVHALGLWAEQCAADAGLPAQRQPAARRGGATPRQHGGGVQEVVRPPQVLETLATQVDSDALARLDGRRRAGLSAAERRLLAFLGHG